MYQYFIPFKDKPLKAKPIKGKSYSYDCRILVSHQAGIKIRSADGIVHGGAQAEGR